MSEPTTGPGTSSSAPAEGRAADDASTPLTDEPAAGEGELHPDPIGLGSPAKVMRIGTMVKQLLEEVRGAPLDPAARSRLAEVHERSLRELESGLSPELAAELRRITLPFSEDSEPSEGELRVAQAQLVGWLEGLFHGLQTALVAQQMTAQAELAQIRRALPPGVHAPDAAAGDQKAPGQYL